MTVVLVRDGPACEPNCFEWIAAEGTITKETPAEFSALLRKLGKRKPPVVVNSGGGNVDAAIRIGELIRQQGLDVAVGRTVFDGCSPGEPCAKALAGRPLQGMIRDNVISRCTSACVLVLAGGNRRLLLWRSVVGVHQVRTVRPEQSVKRYRIYYRIVGGRRYEVRREEIGTLKLPRLQTDPGKSAPVYGRIKAHVRRMGVEPALVDLFHRAGHESMHLLYDPDLKATKLMTARMTASELISPAPATASKSAATLTVPLPPEFPAASFKDTPSFTVPLPPTISAPPNLPPAQHFAGSSVHAEHNGQAARVDLRFIYTREHPQARVELYFAYAGAPVPARLARLEMQLEDGRVIAQNGIMGGGDFAPMRMTMPKADLCRLASGQPVGFALRIWPAGPGAAFDVPFGRAPLRFQFMRSESPCMEATIQQLAERKAAELRAAAMTEVGLARTEIEIGQSGMRPIGLSIEFSLHEVSRLVTLAAVPTAGGRNLPGGAASLLVEAGEGKVWLALRQQAQAPFSPLRASLPLADFCRIAAGDVLAFTFERSAVADEPALTIRREAVALALSGPQLKPTCAALP